MSKSALSITSLTTRTGWLTAIISSRLGGNKNCWFWEYVLKIGFAIRLIVQQNLKTNPPFAIPFYTVKLWINCPKKLKRPPLLGQPHFYSVASGDKLKLPPAIQGKDQWTCLNSSFCYLGDRKAGLKEINNRIARYIQHETEFKLYRNDPCLFIVMLRIWHILWPGNKEIRSPLCYF